MNELLKTKINELSEILKQQVDEQEKDSTKPRVACVIIISEFTDSKTDETKTTADSVHALVGAHNDIHAAIDLAKRESPEMAHFLESDEDPFLKFLCGLSRRG